MQNDALDVAEDSASSGLNNILTEQVSQSIDDLAGAIIEQLVADERFKKLFNQPQRSDQPRKQRLLARQKNKEQHYLLLEDLVAQDNNGLALSIKADQFAKEYLQVVDILYRELEAEYNDFPVKHHKTNSYLQRLLVGDSRNLQTLMRIEVFMLTLLQQSTPAFLYSKEQMPQIKLESSKQLEQRVTRLGREFLFLWSEMDFIKQLNGGYFTRNVQLLADFFWHQDPSIKKFSGFKIIKRDANPESLKELSDLFIELVGFARRGKFQPNTRDHRPRAGFVEPDTEIVKPSSIAMTKDWIKRSQQLQEAIDYFRRYKQKNIVLYRFQIQLKLKNSKVPYEQFQKFFGIVNKKAVRPQGFKGYLDFLYFWKENFITQNLIQDMIIILDASSLIDIPEQDDQKAKLRDIPAEFLEYMRMILNENSEIFGDRKPILKLYPIPVMQSKAWDIPAELIIETDDKVKRAFFEDRILPYFVYMETFDVNYSDDIKNRFKRGQKS
ncbi:hypothetical protein SAMN05421731_102428 [Acinetobacter puyangensis]|uniref:Uncharacterized protein n=2 Tax=Acinetobacter puyangensis TaxID=1096779 RepID=A0A240E684_9GAMM|nr:hypothetical protein SAMN05421731_102428 [Acinetobacter puyangensis]